MDNLFNSNVISAYRRAQAIEDGVLVDVTDMAKAVGIKWHVAVTSSIRSNFIEWTDYDRRRQGLDDIEGRLWHIVFTLHLAIKKTDKHTDVIFFELDILPRDGVSYRVKRIKLKAVVSAGDHFEPIITIMLPEEG